MTLPRLTATLAYALCLTVAACDDDGDGMHTTDAAETTGTAATTESMPADTTGGSMMTTDASSSSSAASTGVQGTTSAESSSTGDELETAEGSTRFEDVVTASGMQALLDLETDLLWVNDVNSCNPLGAPNEDTPMVAMQYCADLMFAGFDDWRMPSADEASELITAALDEQVDLVYANPACPAVIAMGGTAIETHNGDMPGAVIDMPPSIGVRCVRMNAE